MNVDYRNKNPYAIPANLNKHIPYETPPYIPPHAHVASSVDKRTLNFTPYNKPMVFKEQTIGKPVSYIVDMKSSKVFNRLFPMEDKEMKQRNFHLNLNEKPQVKAKPNARSIFKNYKSCPVSPVSEECKWIDKAQQNTDTKTDTHSLDPKKRNSLSFFIGMDNKTIKNKGKSIVDTIKSDTEKMIAEITKKYGDLDEFEPNSDLDIEPTKEGKDDGNFSSDSLEDCSLSQDASCKNKLFSKKVCKKHTKTIPKRSVSNYEIGTTDKPMVPVKPAYISNKSSTLPRNMPSNLDDILDEDSINYNYNNMYRCQSVLTKRCVTRSNESVLSENSNCSSVSNEIFLRYGNEVAFQQAKFDSRYNLNDSQNCSFENLNEADENCLDKHRYSSASFFLNQKKYMKNSCSQESILSDDMFLDNDNHLSRTNCNSLESVLSDDSECTKSAPLEMLFEGARPKRQKNTVNIPRDSKSCYEFDNTSKSYGSSPNNTPHFSYLYNNYLEGTSPKYKEAVVPKTPNNKIYGFEVPTKDLSGHKTVTRSKSLYDSTSQQPPPAKNIAYYFDGNNVQAYNKDNVRYSNDKKDEIPRLSSKDYMANTSKSLQPKFADKHKYKSQMDGCDQNTMVKSKSCSFEVVLEPASKPNPIKNLMEKRNSHVQKNLEKFEEQIRKNTQTKVSKNQMNKDKASGAKYNNVTKSLERGSGQKNNNNNKITMEFVPHKPPKPIKRTSSVKMNNRLKAGMDKAGLTSISSQYKAKLDGLQNKNYLGNRQPDNNSNIDASDTTEKSFDVFVKEKDVNENKSEIQMDSLEVYALQKMERMRHVSMDSLDVIDGNDFAKDSLDYYAEQENKFHFGKIAKDKINIKLAKTDRDLNKPCHSRQNIDSKENIAPVNSDDIKQYKNIERKIEIINKLVEMEERKILQEKFLKEWRMRPLKANIDDGQGVVKLLSRKFENLATKQTALPNFASFTLEENEIEIKNITDNKEIKRNLSLPDILDSEQIGLVTVGEEVSNEAGNEILNNAVIKENAPKSLKQRVYNEMVIPKTDVHLDSENYESSTTSSSCTNSPKRLSLYGLRPKTPFRKVVRVPTPRLCMENKFAYKIRPCLNTGGVIRGALVRKVGMVPVLPSKFTLCQGWDLHD